MLIDVAHSFVNLFAGGRSEIKTLLFFCYLLLLLGTYLLFKKSNVRVKWRLPLKWPIIVLCVGYLYGLVLHLWYSMSLSVSPMDFLITGRNGELSSTTLTHIHEPKGAIAQTLSLFGIGGLRTSDAGGAYIGEVPGWVLSLGTVAIVTAIVAVTVYFVTTFLPSVVLKSRSVAVTAVIFYAVASFALVKAVVDGGIMSPAIYVTAVFVWVYAYLTKRHIPERVLQWGIVAIAVLVVIGLLQLQSDEPTLFVANVATLSALYLLLLWPMMKARRRYFVIVMVLFMAAWLSSSVRDQDIAYYASLKIESGQEYLLYDDASGKVTQTKAKTTSTIGQISDEQDKNISYSPVSAPGVTCFEKGDRVILKTKLRTAEGGTPHFASSAYVSAKQVTEISNGTYSVTFTLDPCTPEPLSTVNGYLIASGVNSYVLINPTIGGDDAGLE